MSEQVQDKKSREDAQVLSRLHAGEEAALEEMVRVYQGPLYGFLLRRTGDPDQALDLVQETFLRALQGLSSFRGDASLKTWLHQIAMNLFLNEKRRPQMAALSPEELEEVQSGAWSRLTGRIPDPEKMVSDQQEIDRLERAIGRMPDEYQVVLLLRDQEGYTSEETAELVGISVGAVRSRLHRARVFVREELLEKSALDGFKVLRGETMFHFIKKILSAPRGEKLTCRDVYPLVSEFIDDEVNPEMMEKIHSHRETCLPCRNFMESLENTTKLVQLCPALSIPEESANKMMESLRERYRYIRREMG